jgi:hypothetical protein
MTTLLAGTSMHRRFTSTEDLRQQGDICRGLASIALSERNRLFWLGLADEWAKLAVTADGQNGMTQSSAQRFTSPNLFARLHRADV